MSKKKSLLRIPLIILSVILVLLLAVISIYYIWFKPKVEVKPIDSEITINKGDMIKKFIPNDLNFSNKKITATATASFSEEELTDLSIEIFKNIDELKPYLTGSKIYLNDNSLDLYLHLKYKNIPLESKLKFTYSVSDGNAIFHYEEGKVGFFNIPKEILFSRLTETSSVKINSENGDVILTLDDLNVVDITNITIEDNLLKISFEGSIKF